MLHYMTYGYNTFSIFLTGLERKKKWCEYRLYDALQKINAFSFQQNIKGDYCKKKKNKEKCIKSF